MSAAFPRVPEGSRKEGFAAGAPSSGCQRLSMRLELKSSGCMHGWSCKALCRLAAHEVSGWSCKAPAARLSSFHPGRHANVFLVV